MLDQAFDALKTYDWGADRNALKPIEEAVVSTQGDAAAAKELETRLAAVLDTGVSRDAKDYVCRQLMLIGTASSVPTLAKLLSSEELSHMARYALERIPAPEAAAALRAALASVPGVQKIGVITSLGSRGDAQSVPALAKLLGDSDPAIARSAALALGVIRTPEAASALAAAKLTSDATQVAAIDSSLACAEQLLADGKKTEALSVYKQLAGNGMPKHVRLAATQGMLAAAGTKKQ